jgi:hypothetical protein
MRTQPVPYCGQLAGAYWGETGIPEEWLEGLAERIMIESVLGDQDYIDKSGDRTYSVGQKLVLKELTVQRLAELVEKLARGLAGGPSTSGAGTAT